MNTVTDTKTDTQVDTQINTKKHDLVVLDMAGTTVADGGLVEQAFSAAAERLGEDPATMIDYVRATMGESKISVFRHLFGGDEDRAQQANVAFEEAYGELVAGGLIAPIPGAAEAVATLKEQGRTVVLTTGFARVTQDAILDALGWRDLVELTLCPADAGGRGRPTRTWSSRPSSVRARSRTSGGSRSRATPRTTCSAAPARAPGSWQASSRAPTASPRSRSTAPPTSSPR